MIRLFAIAFGAILAMMLVAGAIMPEADSASTGPAAPPPTQSASAAVSDAQALVLRRDGSGQFHVTALVEGQDVRFLVDTGADVVALTIDEAEQLGLPVDPGSFQPMMQTASGVGYGAPVTIDSLEVGGQEFRSVPAVVVEGLTVNLLGQSVLRQLGKVELSGDRMIIRPR
ncbi:MAG: TIGR02281 family clan AA aspartic protease [Sphingomonadaceae bacterium]|jgi:aspartyl protease family protein|nr:TIGR02281 family clan AA aspartic protease [Sphingomonadaceae bacterium]